MQKWLKTSLRAKNNELKTKKKQTEAKWLERDKKDEHVCKITAQTPERHTPIQGKIKCLFN